MPLSKKLSVVVSALLLALSASARLAAQSVDVVGAPTNTAAGAARAKGNSYDITSPVDLLLAEFWLNFTGPQTLTVTVHSSPTEFGTYSSVVSQTGTATGSGAGWYSLPLPPLSLVPGTRYIIAVSWSGTLTYYYSTGDSQVTSFGSHTHGYAVGSHPLPATFTSTSNDQAIYHQRLSTAPTAPQSASVTPIGTGCAPGGGPQPQLGSTQLPYLGNATFAVDLSQAPPAAAAYLFLATAAAAPATPLGGGCSLYLDATSLMAFVQSGLFPLGPLATDATGGASWPLPVPALAPLAGAHVFLQAAIATPGSSPGFAVSNALDCLLN